MNFRSSRSKRPDAEVSLTPLIDLFLNILVFFLVTTTFATSSVFYVDLPEAGVGEKLGDRKSVVLSIDSEGQISLDRKIITADDLRAQLDSIPKEKRAQMPIVLRADKNSKHGAVVKVIDVARELGLTNIGIVTHPKSPG
jgi:biopolymer transport protein ExbD